MFKGIRHFHPGSLSSEGAYAHPVQVAAGTETLYFIYIYFYNILARPGANHKSCLPNDMSKDLVGEQMNQ